MNSASVSGRRARRWPFQAWVELISSMRFAISLLAIIAIASMIGTVLKQNEPFNNYVNQFGPFWFEVFDLFSLYAVYNAWWFLTILGFLVLSTSLCLVRNTPRMVRDMRSYRDHVREASLRSFHHQLTENARGAPDAVASRLMPLLRRRGYKVRQKHPGDGVLLAAKAGTGNRLGYIATHAAIVVICVGGLLDSDVLIRMQVLFGDKRPLKTNMNLSDVPSSARLGTGNPTFRGSALISEGKTAHTAVVLHRDGFFVQDLPFSVYLKRFVIDYYSTGMPKLFASEVVVTDRETGQSFPATIKVNHPLVYRGIAVYQASFDDGGSQLKVTGYPLVGMETYPIALSGEVGASTRLQRGAEKTGEYTVEFTGFRPINVEDMSQGGSVAPVDKSLSERMVSVLGPGAAPGKQQTLRNVGPSFQYKLRDASGQAREFNHYMLPMDLDGVSVILTGMRESPNESFRYLRIPVDEAGTVKDFMRLRAALHDPAKRLAAAEAFARDAAMDFDGSSAQSPAQTLRLRQQLAQSTERALQTFAQGGLKSVADFLEKAVPKPDQEKAAEVFLKLLNGALWHLWQQARAADGLSAIAPSPQSAQYVQTAMTALSDLFFYGAPVFLQLDSFDHLQASVLQFTRSPGKNIVYLGCLFLVLGVFSMFYIRERRIWIWLKPEGSDRSATQLLLAMSGTRRSLDFEREFQDLCLHVRASAQGNLHE